MATIRNLTRAMVAFDLPALGTVQHRGGVNALDPGTGQRGFRPHVRTLPQSVTLTACHDPRAPLSAALADGSAVDGLSNEVPDDPAIVSRVAARTLWVERSPDKPAPATHEEEVIQ